MRRRPAPALLLAAIVPLLGVAGCGSKPKPEPEGSAAVTPTPTPMPHTPPDKAGDTTAGTTPPAGNPLPPPKPSGEVVPPKAPGATDPMRPGGTTFPPFPPAPPPDTTPRPKDPPTAGMNPQVPPQPPKDPLAKDPPKEPKKEFEWPTALYGKGMNDFIREAMDADPAIREFAMRTLPGFGPAARREAAKVVLNRMEKETDPGVRAAAYEAAAAFATMGKDGRGREIGFEDETDTKEAIRLLYNAADQGLRGGGTRLHAIQTLAAFGPKAEVAVSFLTGQNISSDSAYETRRALAVTLGVIGSDDQNVPNVKALNCLLNTLIHDPSAAVRLAAFQSVVSLGPPQMPPAPGAPAKPPPKIDEKLTAGYVASIKKRLQPAPKPAVGLVEKDRQVEIFARLALMRLDAKEITDENLDGITKYLDSATDSSGVRQQALGALAALGPGAERRINNVVKAMKGEDLAVAFAAVNTLAAMGKLAKPAVEQMEAFEKELLKQRDQKWADKQKEPEFQKQLASLNLKPEAVPKFLIELRDSMPEEQLRKQIVAAIAYIQTGQLPGAAPMPMETKP